MTDEKPDPIPDPLDAWELAREPDRCTGVTKAGDALRQALRDAREKAKAMNRRCQALESGMAQKVEDAKRQGGSLGRAFANAAATMYEARAEKAEAERDAARRLAEQWCHACASTYAADEQSDLSIEQWLATFEKFPWEVPNVGVPSSGESET